MGHDPTNRDPTIGRGPRWRSRLGVASLIVVVAACGSSGTDATARQRQVEAKGSTVMPFDQDRTTHVFRATETGGVQRVVAQSADASDQIPLIRSHLRTEAKRFAVGDFRDPMAIHGATMPGVSALRRGFVDIAVEYATIPNGASITYTTSDPKLIAALHVWFDAQLMDHGAHAHG